MLKYTDLAAAGVALTATAAMRAEIAVAALAPPAENSWQSFKLFN